MNKYTSFLYVEPSALEGAARLLDFAGELNEYNLSETPEEADARAVAADWAAVGDDLRVAIEKFAGEIETQRAQLEARIRER